MSEGFEERYLVCERLNSDTSVYLVVAVDVLPDLLVALSAARHRFSYLHNQSLIKYLDPNVKVAICSQGYMRLKKGDRT